MLEKIRQEIVVIIISISSMLITAFATIYGVQITNEHNLKMQNRQFKVEIAKKEIEKLDNILIKLASIYHSYREMADGNIDKNDRNKLINEITLFLVEIQLIDKEIYNKYKTFVEIITYEKDNEEKATISFIHTTNLIKKRKEKIEESISNSL